MNFTQFKCKVGCAAISILVLAAFLSGPICAADQANQLLIVNDGTVSKEFSTVYEITNLEAFDSTYKARLVGKGGMISGLRGQIVQIVQFPPSSENLTEVASDTERLQRASDELRVVAQKYERARVFLTPVIQGLARDISFLQSGNVRAEGKWIPKAEYDRVQAEANKGIIASLTLKGKTYSKVRLKSVLQGTISFSHDVGFAKIAIADLDERDKHLIASAFNISLDQINSSSAPQGNALSKPQITPGVTSVPFSIPGIQQTPSSTAPATSAKEIRVPPATPVPKDLFTNSLAMKFARIEIPNGESKDKAIYFSIWETRMCDYAAYAKSRPDEIEDVQWQKPQNRKGENPHPHAPVRFVNSRDATAFCLWLTAKEHKEGVLPAHASYRVPTDHEWSCAVGIGQAEDPKASAASKDGKIADVFPWGTAWPPPKGVGNIRVDRDDLDIKFNGLAPVGSFAPGMFGLYDMAGNVGEVVVDDTMVLSPAVSRGCSWMEIDLESPKSDFFSSKRSIFDSKDDITYPTHRARFSDVGFRCVMEVEGNTKDPKSVTTASGDASLALEPTGKLPESGLAETKAAEGHNADAQWFLGLRYLRGEGASIDEKRAAALFREAAKQDHAQACYDLGVCYEKGIGVENDPNEAAKWLAKAWLLTQHLPKNQILSAEHPLRVTDPEKQVEYGIAYLRGKSQVYSKKNAFYLFQRSAQRGNRRGQYCLGLAYSQGDGVEKDEKKEFEWLKKSADQNWPPAQFRLGECYFWGHGVSKDKNIALLLFQKALPELNGSMKDLCENRIKVLRKD